MPSFNPKDDHGGDDKPPAAGIYMLGCTWFTRKTSERTQADYLRCCFEVANPGEMKGRSFFTVISLDATKGGSMKRLELICESVGQSEPFEIGSTAEGTHEEGDTNWTRILKGHAFKGKVTRKQSGEYTNTDIDKIVPRRTWSDEDVQMAKAWEKKFAEGNDDYGEPDEDGDDDSWTTGPDNPPDSAPPEEHDPQGGDDGYGAPPDDDDIPF